MTEPERKPPVHFEPGPVPPASRDDVLRQIMLGLTAGAGLIGITVVAMLLLVLGGAGLFFWWATQLSG